MNLGLWPEAVPYDPEDGAGSEELDKHLSEVSFPGAALVVVGRGQRDSEWASQAVIGLARSLAAAGRDVLLADLDFEAPSLHELLSESAVEGLADVLLFGASLERVTVLPAGQSFEFVPAGGYAPDPETLRADPAWDRLLAGLAARETVFLGFTQFDVAGLDRLAAVIPSVVLLVDPKEAAATAAWLPEQIRIEAMIRPPGPVAGSVEIAPEAGTGLIAGAYAEAVGAAAPPEQEPPAVVPFGTDEPEDAPADPGDDLAAGQETPRTEAADFPEAADTGPVEKEAGQEPEAERIRLPKDEAREALIAELEARERAVQERASLSAAAEIATPGSPSDEAAVAESGIDVTRDAVAGPSRPPKRRWGWFAAAAVVVAGGASAWYFGFRGDDNSEPPPPQAAQPQAPPESIGDVLGWSVAIEAHDRLDVARRRVDELGAADSSLSFYIAPALVNDALWYRVLAGPLADSNTAVLVMQRLVDSGLKRGAAPNHVRETPLSFLIGRFQRDSVAVVRLQEIGENGIPAYIVEVPYSHGGPWYHLYGGAYSTPLEAERMRQMLRDAGLPDTLVTRVGRAAS